MIGFQGDKLTSEESREIELAPGKSANLRIPLVKANADGKPLLRIFAGGRISDFPVSLRKVPMTVPGKEIVMKKDDLETCWSVTPSGTDYLLKLRVKDSTDSGKEAAGRHPWEQDCAEFFFDLKPEDMKMPHPKSYTENTFRIFVMPRLEPGKQTEFQISPKSSLKPSDFKVCSGLEKDGWKAEIVIPARLCGDLLGFNIKINDSLPGKKTHRELQWIKASDSFKDRMVFGIII